MSDHKPPAHGAPVHAEAHAATPNRGLKQRLAGVLGELRELPRWAKRNPARAAVAGLIVTCLLATLGGGGYYLATVVVAPPVTPPDPLVEAFKSLDAGDLPTARKFAIEVTKAKKNKLAEIGDPLFVLGVTIALSADQHWNREQRMPLYSVAARYLEQSRSNGFPAGRESQGHYQLGRCLHFAGRFAESVPELKAALAAKGTEAKTSQRAELLGLLAESYLQKIPPDLSQALQQNQALLQEERLSPLDQQTAALRESRIYLQQGDVELGQAALTRIPATSVLGAERALMQGQLLLVEADRLRSHEPVDVAAVSEKLAAAVDALRSVPVRDIPLAITATSQYLLGRCYEWQTDASAAEKQFERVRRQFRKYPEYIAATADLANLLMVRNAYAEAVDIMQELLGTETSRENYRNGLISLDQLRKQIADMREALLAAKQYDIALDLATGPDGLIPEWQFALWRADTFKERALTLEQQASEATLAKKEELQKQARSDHRRAGEAFERLAELRKSTRNYTDDLWKTVEEFSAGRDFNRTLRAARTFLRYEANKMQPEAMFLLGEAQLALGRLDHALETFRDCMAESPRHPVTYRARFLSAQAEVEKNRLTEAKELLNANLVNDELSPRSTEWRESLFLLGKLHHREGLEWGSRGRTAGVDDPDLEKVRAGLRDLEQSYQAHRRAIESLARAVERFPAAPQTKEARYLLAESHRHAAQWPLKRLKVITIESTRIELAKQSDQLRREAVSEFDAAIEHLQQSERDSEATPFDHKLLRNCYFGKASTLFDLGRFEEAIKAYSAATNYFQNEPEALEAYVQIASCYRLLNRPKEARGTLEQAKVMLQRIAPNANFALTTPYTRQEWDELLTWLATL